MKCADLPRRLFQVLPTASARRERPVTSTPPGGSALLIVSLLALKVILTGSNNWYDHTDWAGARLLPSPTPGLSSPTAPPSSDSLPSPISRTNYQLVWSDEFNGTSVDASKWNKVGPWGHSVASGWANFNYLTSNVSVANGLATITVQKSGSNWTGGILSTDTTKTFQYGFFEVSAKLPAGQGFWPAIWLCHTNAAWAATRTLGELDIMEFLGGDVTHVYQSMHESTGALEQVAPTSTNWTSGYHLFQMLWEPGQVTFYIDNVETASFTTNVPAEPMYLMLNFDVGGPNNWGGAPNSSTPTTATFNVDYVRVYQQSTASSAPTPTPTRPPTDVDPPVVITSAQIEVVGRQRVIVLQLSGPVNSATADKLASYKLTQQRKGVQLVSATYNPANNTIRLTTRLALPPKLRYPFTLTLVGLKDAHSNPVGGTFSIA